MSGLIEIAEPESVEEIAERYRASRERLTHLRRSDVDRMIEAVKAECAIEIAEIKRDAALQLRELRRHNSDMSVMFDQITTAQNVELMQLRTALTTAGTEGAIDYGARVFVAEIQRHVCKVTGFSLSAMIGEAKESKTIAARHVSIWACRQYSNPQRSYPFIGQNHGNKDHSTVIAAKRKVSAILNYVGYTPPADYADAIPEVYKIVTTIKEQIPPAEYTKLTTHIAGRAKL